VALSLHAPEFVNYACQLCGWCCRQYDISFSRADFERLSKFDWASLEPALAGKEWAQPLRDLASPDEYRLRFHDGACVFLGGDRCLMHKHVGEMGKTLGCSVFPFTFAATPSGVYVGCRFSCKSLAYGLGEPLARRMGCIQKQLALCAAAGRVPRYDDQVVWDGRRKLPWADYLALEEVLIRVFLRDDLPLPRRLFLAQKFVDILDQAKLDRVSGPKFRELMEILETGLLQEAQIEPFPGKPKGISRLMFRQFLFLFQRRQGGAYREMSFSARLRARLRTFWTGIQFVFNFGAPELAGIPGRVPLKKVAAAPPPPLDGEAEIALSRFLAAKLYGKQHFGKLFFNYPLRSGLEFFLLSAGAVLWYARAEAVARGEPQAKLEDVLEAIRCVDFCYGYSAAPAASVERLRVRLLSHGDAAIRLILAQCGEGRQTTDDRR
jgi:Fe-S-cluster containining protein